MVSLDPRCICSQILFGFLTVKATLLFQMGGQIATIFARDHPKAQGLCLIAPSGLCDEPYTGCMPCFGGSRAPHPVIGCHEEDWRRCISDKQSVAARDFVNLQGGMFENSAEAKDCIPRVERQFDAHGGEETLVKVLSRVGRRIFLIWGKDDEVVPYSTGMERWQKILDEVRSFPRLSSLNVCPSIQSCDRPIARH
jgi:pimeloyl-ACP methyl ester carboxylesterase